MKAVLKRLGPHDWAVLSCVGGFVAAYSNGLLRPAVLASETYVGWLSVSGFFTVLVVLARICLPEILRAWFAKLASVPRLYLLTLFLLFAFTSRIFFGFWFVGIGGWTFDKWEPPGVPVSEAQMNSLSDVEQFPARHLDVLATSFRPSMPPAQGERCWPTRVYLAETHSRKEPGDERALEVRTISPESFGWVFPDYLDDDLHRSIDALELLWNPRETSYFHFLVMSSTGWEKWRYPSHTPSNSGISYFPDERVNGLFLYELELCNTAGGEVNLTAVELVDAAIVGLQ